MTGPASNEENLSADTRDVGLSLNNTGRQVDWQRLLAQLNAPKSFAPTWVPDATHGDLADRVSPAGDAVVTQAVSVAAGESSTGVSVSERAVATVPQGMPPLPDSHPPTAFPAIGSPQPFVNAHTESGIQIDLDEAEEDDDRDQLAVAMDAAPPWLISLAVHLVLIVVLGLLALTSGLVPPLDLEVTFADTLGEQVDQETFDMAETSLDDEPVVTPSDMTAIDDPLASPHNSALELPDQILSTAPFEAPNIGLALSGREQGMKETLLLAYGGSKLTEAAVADALEWLKRNQRKDGSWRLDGPYSDGSAVSNPLAATAMALLAFQGAGFTHQSERNMVTDSGDATKVVDYRKVVRKGWYWMLETQSKDGNFWQRGGVDHQHHKLYSHAQATIAICELYGMTRDEDFRRPAQLAVNYCCEIQDDDGVAPDGGWKYDPHRDSDTSVTGWFVMALQSARMAGLDVPSDVFAKVAKFLDSVTEDGTYYAYMPGYAAKPSLTAEGLLCRQYLGWKRDDPRLIEGAEYLSRNPVDWSDTNTYYWYYATQVMHHMEGDYWFDWNQKMSSQIPAKQVRSGPEKGSWSPDGDIWGQGGGRLYMTCLCTYMLEVYYRHLPIYSKAF